jgi:hypothetical protein
MNTFDNNIYENFNYLSFLPDNIVKKFEFLNNLIRNNIYFDKIAIINYLKSIFFENQFKLENEKLFYLLIEIFKFKQNSPFENYKDPDFEYFYLLSIELGLKFKKIKEVIDIQIHYINYLYRNLEYNKAQNLICNLINNYSDYLNQEQKIKIKEISILIETNFLTVKNYKNDIFEIFLKEKNYKELVNFFISYNFKYITNFDLENLQNNLGFLLAHAKKENFKNFLKDDILGELNNFIGNIYFYNGYYIKAKRHFFVALKKEIPANDKVGILKLDNNIAICFYELGEFEKSQKYFKILQNDINLNQDKKLLYYVFSNISLIYLRQKKTSLAIQIAKKTLQFKLSINDLNGYFYTIIKFINYFIYFDINIAKEFYNDFKIYINKLDNKILNLYSLIYKNIFEKEKNIKQILKSLILNLDYYPLNLVPFFSLFIKLYPKLKHNYYFKISIYKFLSHMYKEFGEYNFSNFFNSFFEYKNILKIFSQKDETFKYNPIEIIKKNKNSIDTQNQNETNKENQINLKDFFSKEIEINIEKLSIKLLKNILKNNEIKFPDSNKINHYKLDELLFIFLLKILKRGYLKYRNSKYYFDTIFEKKIIKRIDFLQRFYIDKFVFNKA